MTKLERMEKKLDKAIDLIAEAAGDGYISDDLDRRMRAWLPKKVREELSDD